MHGLKNKGKDLNIKCIKMLRNEEDIKQIIQEDKWMMDILKIVDKLKLPDWWIGAGFVRNKVWDYLHEYKKRTPLNDVDVIYFDKNDFTKKEINLESSQSEVILQGKLRKIDSSINWSVTNQARMHVFHNNMPYKDSFEALSKWTETATCIAVKLDNNQLKLISPYGVKDLLNLEVKPTPFSNISDYNRRIKEKKWQEKWPKLKIY